MPEGWAWCRLNQIYNFIDYRGVTPNKIDSGVPLVTAKNVKNGYIDYSISEFISKADYEKRQGRGSPRKGDLLFTTEAPLGNCAIADLDIFSPGQRIITFQQYTNTEFLNNKLFLYFILSDKFQELIYNKRTGTTVTGIKAEKLKLIFIPLPPKKEQDSIISVIENIYLHINSIEKSKLDLQEIIKQTKSKILDLAIHGKLVPQDPKDEPAEELLNRIATSDNRPYEKVESSEIDWTLPNNWCLCHFGDIATVINGKNQSKVENPNGKYPIYGSGGIMGRADDYICPENCTIIGRKGSINNPIFVEEKFWNVDTAFGLSPSEAVLPKFLFYFCEYFDFTTLDSSTTLPSLTKTNIQQIVFALPPIEEQKRILDKTNEVFGKLDEIVLNLI